MIVIDIDVSIHQGSTALSSLLNIYWPTNRLCQVGPPAEIRVALKICHRLYVAICTDTDRSIYHHNNLTLPIYIGWSKCHPGSAAIRFDRINIHPSWIWFTIYSTFRILTIRCHFFNRVRLVNDRHSPHNTPCLHNNSGNDEKFTPQNVLFINPWQYPSRSCFRSILAMTRVPST